jgi:tripartite-type tricarboxylate transporter receptor subunit TctC
VTEVLQKAVRDALQTAPVQERLGKMGMHPQASTALELQSHLQREIKRWGEVIRAAKIDPE